MSAYVHRYGTPEQERLRKLAHQPGAGLGWVVHKSTAVR